MKEVNTGVSCNKPGFWNLRWGETRQVLRGFAQNLPGQKQAGTFTAEPAAAARGEDYLIDNVVKVSNFYILLGDIDHIKLVGEKPAEQGHLQPTLCWRVKFFPLTGHGTIAVNRLHNFRRGGIRAVNGFDKKIGFLLYNPFFQTKGNLIIAQVGGSDFHCPPADLHDIV